MKVGVIGAGHVGLPTAAVLSKIGHTVCVTDLDRPRLERLAEGEMPFYEPGMEELVKAETAIGRLTFSHDPAPAVKGADVVFICVGTPPRASGEANLVAMERAAESVAKHADGDTVVVQKSTVPSGTASRLAEHLARYGADHSFEVVSNPEFLREGRAINDSFQPDRILVGSDSPRALATMRALYAPIVDGGSKWIETDVATAELAKHACNAFLATKIAFANALARVCELAGGDVVAVADVMGSDPRIGRQFLDAGLGYGGYCFPKDLAAFERLSARLGYDFALLREVEAVNEGAIEVAFSKIEQELWNLEEKRIALLGLAFKAGTDDTRFSPALNLAQRLIKAGATVVGFDPQANETAKRDLPELEITEDPYTAVQGAHCLVIGTEWDEFASLDLNKIKGLMTFPIIVDGRNIFDRAVMAEAGFTYLPTGRPSVRMRTGDRRGDPRRPNL